MQVCPAVDGIQGAFEKVEWDMGKLNWCYKENIKKNIKVKEQVRSGEMCKKSIQHWCFCLVSNTFSVKGLLVTPKNQFYYDP